MGGEGRRGTEYTRKNLNRPTSGKEWSKCPNRIAEVQSSPVLPGALSHHGGRQLPGDALLASSALQELR